MGTAAADACRSGRRRPSQRARMDVPWMLFRWVPKGASLVWFARTMPSIGPLSNVHAPCCLWSWVMIHSNTFIGKFSPLSGLPPPPNIGRCSKIIIWWGGHNRATTGQFTVHCIYSCDCADETKREYGTILYGWLSLECMAQHTTRCVPVNMLSWTSKFCVASVDLPASRHHRDSNIYFPFSERSAGHGSDSRVMILQPHNPSWEGSFETLKVVYVFLFYSRLALFHQSITHSSCSAMSYETKLLVTFSYNLQSREICRIRFGDSLQVITLFYI